MKKVEMLIEPKTILRQPRQATTTQAGTSRGANVAIATFLYYGIDHHTSSVILCGVSAGMSECGPGSRSSSEGNTRAMRTAKIDPHLLLSSYVSHETSEELKQISEILDNLPGKLLQLVLRDLSGGRDLKKGRKGMPAEQVLRVYIVKQMTMMSYKKLSIALLESTCYRAFCLIEVGRKLKLSTIKANVKRISAQTVEIINREVMRYAGKAGIENGKKVRTDTTNVHTNIHAPTDSWLLGDVNRVLHRLMTRSREKFNVQFCGHERRARKRAIEVELAKSQEARKPLYKDLLVVMGWILVQAEQVRAALYKLDGLDILEAAAAEGLAADLEHYVQLGHQVVDQTQRRVFNKEQVPPEDKIVSIFETHTDILVKGKRAVEFGHKICLTTGKSGLITDLQIFRGNPADVTMPATVIERHVEIFGHPPRQTAMDGGFASGENLDTLKGMGVLDVAFSKPCGLELTDMVKSEWVYRQLRKFRAQIEGTISFLKRCFGVKRCTWRGFASFQSYVWGATLSANLVMLSRHLLKQAKA